MRGGAQRRGLNGAEGAAGFRDHQGEETIHAAPKAPENISAGKLQDAPGFLLRCLVLPTTNLRLKHLRFAYVRS